MKYKAIILDFDGVILESNHIKDEAFRHVFSGYPHHLDEIMQYHQDFLGIIRFKKFKHITESILHETYTPELERNLARRFSDYALGHLISCSYVKGAKEFLDFFYTKYPLFLVSANPPQDLDYVLRSKSLDRYFKKVYATDEKAQAIEDILRNNQWKPQEVIFIGDSWLDYQSCQQAKVNFLGRDSGSFKSLTELKVFSDLEEIQNYLK